MFANVTLIWNRGSGPFSEKYSNVYLCCLGVVHHGGTTKISATRTLNPFHGIYLCYLILHYATLYHIMLPYITMCYLLLQCVIVYYILLPHITLCYLILLCVTLYYNVLPYITMCYSILHYVTL